jgi:hypothetical protein
MQCPLWVSERPKIMSPPTAALLETGHRRSARLPAGRGRSWRKRSLDRYPAGSVLRCSRLPTLSARQPRRVPRHGTAKARRREFGSKHRCRTGQQDAVVRYRWSFGVKCQPRPGCGRANGRTVIRRQAWVCSSGVSFCWRHWRRPD